MRNETLRSPKSAEGMAPSTSGLASPAHSGWRWARHLRSVATENLVALLAIRKLPPALVSARSHSPLLSRSRTRFISARLGPAAIFLCLATIAWIPIDVVLFNADWNVVTPLMAGRVVAALLFLSIASLELRSASPLRGVAAIALLIGVGIGFFLYAHIVIEAAGPSHLAGPAHAQYLLMPVALAAGISIFPLALLEAGLLSAGPLIALTAETLLNDGYLTWHPANVAVILMFSVVVTTTVSSVSQLKLLSDLHEQSAIDSLTDTFSRRAGTELMGMLFARSERSNSPFSLALIDLDYFKKVNDGYGHDAGDRLLREVAQGLKGGLRREDVVIRWGGEEFVVLLFDTAAEKAAQIVVELCRFGLGRRPDGSVQTVSAGLAERQIDNTRNWQRLVEIADSRMYDAKTLGRDRLTGPAAKSCRLVGDGPAIAESAVPRQPYMPE